MKQIIFTLIFCTCISNINCKNEKYIVNASTLLVRKGPSTNTKIIGRLKTGEIVEVIELTEKVETIEGREAPWVKIKINNTFGYVFSGFLNKSSVEIKKEKTYEELKVELSYLSCDGSIKLKKQEYAYGPPNDPSINTSVNEYNNKKLHFSSFQENSDKLFELAYLAYRHNDLENAEKYLKLCISNNNFESEFYKRLLNFYLANIYEKQNNFEKAKKYYLKYNDKYYLHLIEAKINEKNNKLELAEKEYLLAQSLKLYEMANYEPFRFISEMYYKHKKYTRALIYIEQYIYCVEREKEMGGEGYMPSSNKHIRSANKFYEQIKDKLKKY